MGSKKNVEVQRKTGPSQSVRRFVLEGTGAFTAVDGERSGRDPGDFDVTPSMTWHDHSNETSEPMYWLDGLDIPMVQFFDASFAEDSTEDQQKIPRPPGDSFGRYGHNLLPVDGKRTSKTSPIFNYPYSHTREALEQAATRIALYHQKQLAASWEYTEADGTRLGQKVTPLDRVGLYVPGGKAAYPSSVLMNAIPARVAGVGELIMVVPTPRGERNALVLAAAALAGVDRVFALGGAQAVGALAYGTQTIPQVDKIVGPGNAYVAAAKRRVFGVVGIDMVAGPLSLIHI